MQTSRNSNLASSDHSKIEKKDFKDININEFIEETQFSLTKRKVGLTDISLAWWIPAEYWKISLSHDNKQENKQKILKAFEGVSLLVVAQAEVNSLGAFDFYTKDEVERNLKVSFIDRNGVKQKVELVTDVSQEAKLVVSFIKPVLSQAMGRMGESLHIYFIKDQSNIKERLIDPYEKGRISIQKKSRSGEILKNIIEVPLNSLFVPIKCPNGKDAHISWEFCPWTGKQLNK
jgi:hypothetical protein